MSVNDASRDARTRWDKEHLTTIGCKVTKEKAEEFRIACEKRKTNRNAVLLAYVNKFIEESHKG